MCLRKTERGKQKTDEIFMVTFTSLEYFTAAGLCLGVLGYTILSAFSGDTQAYGISGYILSSGPGI